MPSSPAFRPVLGAAAVLLALLAAACTPPTAQPRLPGDAGLATPEQARAQAKQLVRTGRSTLSAGDADAAAGAFEQALILDGDNAEAAIGLGDALLRQNRPQEAGEAYGRAFTRGGARAHEGYARAMIALNRPEGAVEHLETARRLAPDDTGVLNALGVAYDLTGRHKDAVAAYRAGLEIAPNDRALRNNLGLSLALAGDPDAAVASLRDLAEGAGSDRRARQNLALAYGLKGDAAAAERLSRLDLSETEVRNNLAIYAALRGLPPADAAAALVPVAAAPTLPPARREPRPAVATPGRPVPLAALALDAGDLAVGASPTGSWFLNLGRAESPEGAARRWQELRRRNPAQLAGLTKLAGAGGGPEPLLVGPLPDEAAARAACGRLRKAAPDCAPVRL
jgi:Flp pilus assembly protein TadD